MESLPTGTMTFLFTDIAGAVTSFWIVRGYVVEGCGWLRDLLERDTGTVGAVVRAKALVSRGRLLFRQGDYSDVGMLVRESLAIYRTMDDRDGVAASLNILGLVELYRGDPVAAQPYFEESLALFRELGDRRAAGVCQMNLGLVAHQQADHATARALIEASLAIFRELGNLDKIASCLVNLGVLALDQEDLVSARAFLEEYLAMSRELGNLDGIALALGNLGLLVREQGDPDAARTFLEESLTMRVKLGDKHGIVWLMHQMASVAVSLSDPLWAARLWGAAEHLSEEVPRSLSSGDPANDEPEVRAARAALADDAAFDAAWAEGRAMSLDQAVALAREDSRRNSAGE